MAVAGAIIGAAIGGWMNNALGRKKSILIADVLFFVGAIVMAVAPVRWVIIFGRIIVGLEVGMASMTAPLYISEASPHKIRGALVSTNGLPITGGQFLSYLVNLALARAPGTCRWMLGVAGITPLVQFVLMLSLPESPRWLYRENKVDEARAILAKIYPAEEVDDELKTLHESVEFEKSEEGAIGKTTMEKLKGAFRNKVVRRALYAGITVQVAQQFEGINTVMYYSPTIVQFAGLASNQTAIALSLITSGLNVVGPLISMRFVDKYRRRRLMIIFMFGIISCLVVLAGVFFYAATHSPAISHRETIHFGTNTTCSAYVSAANPASWNCMTCLKSTNSGSVLVELIIGTGGGIAAISNWTPNLIVSQTFLTLTKELGSAGTFLLFVGFSTIGLIFIHFLVPETKGMQFEEVNREVAPEGFPTQIICSKGAEVKGNAVVCTIDN